MHEDSVRLEKLEAELAKHPDLPEEVRDWIVKAIRAGVNSEFLQELQEYPRDVISRSGGFFKKAREILRSDNRSLVRGTDFDSADLDPERFDAMVAELRVVGFLNDQGFTGIRLLAATRRQRGADIVAICRDTRWAVEVVCSSRAAYRYPDHKRRSSDLTEWIVDKFREKEEQLNWTALNQDCAKCALGIVLNSWPALPLLNRNGYMKTLREAWTRLGKSQDAHLAIVTGMVTLGVGLDDCVFPPWSGDSKCLNMQAL
jgi:hypothetical protein